jgi:DNA polymerase III sliding clamp (beta) subunit (PCNA family)
MKVNRQEFSSALALTCKIAPKVKTWKGKVVFDWRTNVRLVARDGALFATATDGNNFATINVDVHSRVREEFSIMVGAHELFAFIKAEGKKPHEMIQLNVALSGLIATLEIVLENGNLRKVGEAMNCQEFPFAPTTVRVPNVASYDSRELASALAFTIPCASTDETRPHICRVAFLGRRIATTDGCRLHVAETSTNGPTEATISPIAAKALQSACLLVDRFDCYLNQDSSKAGYVHFVSSRLTITAKLICFDYPPIDQVIPVSVSHYVMRTKELVKALKSAALDGVKFTCNGDITIDVTTDGVSSHSVVNTLRSPSNENVIVVGFDRQLVLAALNTKDETVSVQITGRHDPMRIDHGQGCVAVVMPMRL